MLNCLWLGLLFVHSVFPQTTDKYTDENRPYKFGFNIQGYQHREEEKDERGLIKGEYGFITADGYYRVTVYATDENGDFRIISMKNYYVGFPPEDPTTTPGPPSDRATKARQPISPLVRGPTGRALGDDSTPKTPKAFTRPQGIAACSDCSIPTTTSRTNEGNLPDDNDDFRTGRARGGPFGSNFGQGPAGQSPQFPQASPRGNIQTPRGPVAFQFPQTGNAAGPGGSQPPQGTPRLRAGFPGSAQEPVGNQPPQGAPRSRTDFPGNAGSVPTGPGNAFDGGRRPGGIAGSTPTGGAFGSRGLPKGPTNFEENNQLGNTPNRRPQIGEVREGLPPGVTLNDIKDLLYTFNYTVGFHGHHEDGYRNGDKHGDYFFDGRDGVERKVEYLANEFGYQPNITLIDLPENDVRRPKEQTEKEYGLKGYEFKWFYRK